MTIMYEVPPRAVPRLFGALGRLELVKPHDPAWHEGGTTSALGLCCWHGKPNVIPAVWDILVDYGPGATNYKFAVCHGCLMSILTRYEQ